MLRRTGSGFILNRVSIKRSGAFQPKEATKPKFQIRVSADDILVATERPRGISAGNVISGAIRRIETLDGEALLTVLAGDEFFVRLTSSAISRLALKEDSPIFLIIKTRSFRVL